MKPFPVAFDDCYLTLQYIKDHAGQYNIRTDRIFTGGDSAVVLDPVLCQKVRGICFLKQGVTHVLLVADIDRNGLLNGVGKPEPLKFRIACNRRITDEHRLVYNMDNKQNLIIYACRDHYEE